MKRKLCLKGDPTNNAWYCCLRHKGHKGACVYHVRPHLRVEFKAHQQRSHQ